MYKVIKHTGIKLYKYFKPSNDNLVRTLGFVNAMVVVPTANFLLPRLFIKNNESGNPHDDLTSNLAAVAVVNYT